MPRISTHTAATYTYMHIVSECEMNAKCNIVKCHLIAAINIMCLCLFKHMALLRAFIQRRIMFFVYFASSSSSYFCVPHFFIGMVKLSFRTMHTIFTGEKLLSVGTTRDNFNDLIRQWRHFAPFCMHLLLLFIFFFHFISLSLLLLLLLVYYSDRTKFD